MILRSHALPFDPSPLWTLHRDGKVASREVRFVPLGSEVRMLRNDSLLVSKVFSEDTTRRWRGQKRTGNASDVWVAKRTGHSARGSTPGAGGSAKIRLIARVACRRRRTFELFVSLGSHREPWPSKPGAAGSSPAGRAIRLACREWANAGSLMASHGHARQSSRHVW